MIQLHVGEWKINIEGQLVTIRKARAPTRLEQHRDGASVCVADQVTIGFSGDGTPPRVEVSKLVYDG